MSYAMWRVNIPSLIHYDQVLGVARASGTKELVTQLEG